MLALICTVGGPWLHAFTANNFSPLYPCGHICTAAVGIFQPRQPAPVTIIPGFVAQTYAEQDEIVITSKAGE